MAITSVRDAIEKIVNRHKEYIEANYHISNPGLINERRILMNNGYVNTVPWIEGSPKYELGEDFANLSIPEEIASLLSKMREVGLAFRPYLHQSRAITSFFSSHKNLIISTGTGSGKTEIFLYAFFGLLAQEAKYRKSNRTRAIRCVVLYPMNALVSDQLARLRKLMGSSEGEKILENIFGRTVQFGMYTSRTPYHGLFDKDKNKIRIEPIVDYFLELKERNRPLYEELYNKGKIPSKNLEKFSEGETPDQKFTTHKGDVELFTRQEMLFPNEHGGAPDLIVTNYSMLEYMLLRPIEQPLFESTKNWLKMDKKNELLIVIDEAHLYRGAQGAEVAMLIRRLLNHLEIGQDRVRFILSSASLGSPLDIRIKGAKFGSDLTGSPQDSFEVITGTRLKLPETSNSVETITASQLISNGSKDFDLAGNFLYRESSANSGDFSKDELGKALGRKLQNLEQFRILYNAISEKPMPLNELASIVFPKEERLNAETGTLNLLQLVSKATTSEAEKLMPVRLHMFFKGLPKLYVCVNPKCEHRRDKNNQEALLGKIYTEPRFQCECGARVFELLTDRDCGAAYIKAFRRSSDRLGERVFLWDELQSAKEKSELPYGAFDELHILVEPPRKDPDLKHKQKISLYDQTRSSYLNIYTGHILNKLPKKEGTDYISVWVPKETFLREDPGPVKLYSWHRCPACGRTKRRHKESLSIMDLETKGEEPFANLVKELFNIQPIDNSKLNFPNKGKKVLCFSDGRQKAARLARDLQRAVERDSFREMIVEIKSARPKSTLDSVFPAFVYLAYKDKIGFFDDEDAIGDGNGSRTLFEQAKRVVPSFVQRYNISDDKLIDNPDYRDEVFGYRPKQFNVLLLRTLGSRYYSIRELMIGYLEPLETVFEIIKSKNAKIEPKLLYELLLETLHSAVMTYAYDKSITDIERLLARQSLYNPSGRSRGEEGEGLSFDELIPTELLKHAGVELSDTELKVLRDSITMSSQTEANIPIPRLFDRKNERWYVNPSSVNLKIGLSDVWYRCSGCRQFTPKGIAGRCPECGGELEEVPENDPHLLARRKLFRDPCREVYEGNRSPFTLRSEEHSAQIESKDLSEIFSPSEKYELLFQDMLVGDSKNDQPIDVLSSTTTMEVGIDIGSLTGVGMRTIPPLASNYQQRAGRAGRRGTDLSVIITFADNSPYESYIFYHPNTLIGSSNIDPIIYVKNKRIIERHINATLLQMFFQKAPIDRTANIFSSLGLASDFFNGEGDNSLKEFKKWIKNNIENENSLVTKSIISLLPKLDEAEDNEHNETRNLFLKEVTNKLLSSLTRLSKENEWNDLSQEENNLLRTVLSQGILPTFSFPLDVCSFGVFEIKKGSHHPKIKYKIDQDTKMALSEYVPPRQIVVDKRTYTSYGLYFPFSRDSINRARKVSWDNLHWLNYCDRCETVIAENIRNMESEGAICPTCRSQIKSLMVYKPEGFSPEYRDRTAVEGEEIEEDRIYAKPAKFPLADGILNVKTDEKSGDLKNAEVYSQGNQELEVVNFGPNEKGFHVCKSCGSIGNEAHLSTLHNRPYPVPAFNGQNPVPQRCDGSQFRVVFGYTFRSDLTIMRIKVNSLLKWEYGDEWFKSACQSLSEALVLGATRTLSIDSREISGGYRMLQATTEDEQKGILGYIEFFLYDTTPGGAGFASSVRESFDKVLLTTKFILDNCTCERSCTSCLRNYNNRSLHEKLDRYLALALLQYATEGVLPVVGIIRSKDFLMRISKTIEIMDSGLENRLLEKDGKPYLEVKSKTLEIQVELTSCFIQTLVGDASKVTVTDYDVLHNLPTVVSTIMGKFG